ncbi:MAG TPA: hypothetical protein VM537_20535 [Anaerolineae bacterium]|nr:hypothetical protein [Anaerolineae bacterium]
MIHDEWTQGCGFVLGVQLQDGTETAALFFDVVGIRRQPEPGLEDEGARAREVPTYELG